MRSKTLVVRRYARMWPREIFDLFAREAYKGQGLELLEEPGVYVLYRGDVPYYVGRANKLHDRLWHHADGCGSRYYNFWDFFSAFVVKDKKQRIALEAILISAMPTANGAKPKLEDRVYPTKLKKIVHTLRRGKAKLWVSDMVYSPSDENARESRGKQRRRR